MQGRIRRRKYWSFQVGVLLLLSRTGSRTPIGIGNKELLEKHGIKPVVDLPGVGENLRASSLMLSSWTRLLTAFQRQA